MKPLIIGLDQKPVTHTKTPNVYQNPIVIPVEERLMKKLMENPDFTYNKSDIKSEEDHKKNTLVNKFLKSADVNTKVPNVIPLSIKPHKEKSILRRIKKTIGKTINAFTKKKHNHKLTTLVNPTPNDSMKTGTRFDVATHDINWYIGPHSRSVSKGGRRRKTRRGRSNR